MRSCTSISKHILNSTLELPLVEATGVDSTLTVAEPEILGKVQGGNSGCHCRFASRRVAKVGVVEAEAALGSIGMLAALGPNSIEKILA